MEGKAVIFSAPSGSGKTTIMKRLLDKNLPLAFSVSACSRPKRQGEVHGRDYYFIDVDDFKNKIREDAFVEWEEVYSGSFYGTLKSELQRIWTQGKHVIFDVDVLGGVNIKKIFGNKALAIFIQPPSIKELEIRLNKRSTETTKSLQKRLSRAKMELSYANKFDICIVNDNLEDAVVQAEKVIRRFIEENNE